MTEVEKPELRRQREATVRDHIDAENRQDVDASLATFGYPYYDMVPATTFDGRAAVGEMLAMYFSAFPDLHQDILTLRHADDVVILEVRNTGTHRGEFAGVAPSGNRLDLRSCNIMKFDGDSLVRETVYYDMATLMRQISA